MMEESAELSTASRSGASLTNAGIRANLVHPHHPQTEEPHGHVTEAEQLHHFGQETRANLASLDCRLGEVSLALQDRRGRLQMLLEDLSAAELERENCARQAKEAAAARGERQVRLEQVEEGLREAQAVLERQEASLALPKLGLINAKAYRREKLLPRLEERQERLSLRKKDLEAGVSAEKGRLDEAIFQESLRTQELSEVKEQLESQRQQNEKSREAIEDLSAEQRLLEEKQRAFDEANCKLERELDSLSSLHKQESDLALREEDELNKDLDSLAAEQSEWEVKEMDSGDEARELKRAAAALESEILALENGCSSVSSDVAVAESQLDKSRKKEAQLLAEEAEMTEKRLSDEKVWQDEVAGVQKQIGEEQRALEQADARLRQEQKKRAEKEVEEASIQNYPGELRQKLQDLDVQYQKLLADIKHTQEEINGLRECKVKKFSLEEDNARTRQKIAQLKEKLASEEEQCRDKGSLQQAERREKEREKAMLTEDISAVEGNLAKQLVLDKREEEEAEVLQKKVDELKRQALAKDECMEKLLKESKFLMEAAAARDKKVLAEFEQGNRLLNEKNERGQERIGQLQVELKKQKDLAAAAATAAAKNVSGTKGSLSKKRKRSPRPASAGVGINGSSKQPKQQQERRQRLLVSSDESDYDLSFPIRKSFGNKKTKSPVKKLPSPPPLPDFLLNPRKPKMLFRSKKYELFPVEKN